MSTGTLRPATAEEVGRAAWEAFTDSHPQGTVYHSPQWTDVLADALGMRQRHLFVVADGEVRGFLPLFTRTGKRFSSSPFRDRGGVLAVDGEARDLLMSAVARMVAGGEIAGVEIKPNLGIGEEVPEVPGFVVREPLVVSELVLPRDEEALWRGLNNKVRGKVRQARRAGLELAVPEGEGAERAFYELFWATRRRLGVPSYGPGLFRAIREHMVPAGRAGFLYAMSGGRAVAGMVVFIGGGRMIDGYAASDPCALKSRPNDFLKWEAMSLALARGCGVYDFGADFPEQEALVGFKRKWGAGQRPVRILQGGDMPAGSEFGGSGVARMAGWVLPKLPGAVFKSASAAAMWWLGRSV